ncbi:MAG: hypothetical protein AAF413_03280 [Patescibacteria group bacterium]
MSRVINLKVRSRQIRVIADKLLFIELLKNLEGRLWGIAAITGLPIGFAICFAIRPDLLAWDTAFSDFGRDVRTAPYFSGAIFYGAYALWRWRGYLERTSKIRGLATLFVTMTIFGLYMVALFPVSWEPIASTLHYVGFGIAAMSMLFTVSFDFLLRRSHDPSNHRLWQLIRILSMVGIVAGVYVTAQSELFDDTFDMALLGEIMILLSYSLWVWLKTYHPEGEPTMLSKTLAKIVRIE